MTIRKRAKAGAEKRPSKAKGKPVARRPRRAGKLPPREPQRISLSNAVELTQRYRKAAPASEHGGFFWAEGIAAILAQPGCVGVRYYHGLGADGAYHIVLVGVDEQGNDITMPASGAQVAYASSASASSTAAFAAAGGEAVLLEHHFPCPPYCSSGSPL